MGGVDPGAVQRVHESSGGEGITFLLAFFPFVTLLGFGLEFGHGYLAQMNG